MILWNEGSNANLDKIKNVIDLYVDRKIINFRTPRNIVVQLAHSTKQNIKRAEKQYNNVIAKYINAEPATGRIARQIEAQNEIANQSVIEIDDLLKIKTGFGIIFRGNDKYLHAWVLMNKYKIIKTLVDIF